MASWFYTPPHLRWAIRNRKWDEVRLIIRAVPELVNMELPPNVPLLYEIVLCNPPRDVISESLKSATLETVEYVDEFYHGRCILHRIAACGYAEPLRAAVRISARNVNWQGWDGDTPLHILLRCNHSYGDHIDATNCLLKAGANANLKNEDGETPAEVYANNNCEKYDSLKREEQKEMLMHLLQTGMVPTEILARGTEAMEAFKDALAEAEIEINQGTTIFLGLEGVGKTSTIKSFLKHPFSPDEDISDTSAYIQTVCPQKSSDDSYWKKTAHDHSEVTCIYEEKMSDEIVKRLSEKESEKKKVPVASEQIAITKIVSPDIIDKPETSTEYIREGQLSSGGSRSVETESQIQSIHTVPENIARKVEERMNQIKFRGEATSEWQKSGKEFYMNIWELGGQPQCHAIQRIFLVSFAVVCVVFNLKDDLDAPAKVRDPTTGKVYNHRMTNLEFILYWIHTVYINSKPNIELAQLSPTVLVIGTHLGSLGRNEEEQKNKAEEIFSKIRQAMEGKPYEAMVFSTFFAIENSLPFSESKVSSIMEQILILAKKMVQILPLKWLLVQQEVQKLKVKNIYLPTAQVVNLIDQCGIKIEAKKRLLLEYLHDVGEILYFPDDKDLKDIIFLDLVQIYDMFTKIFTSRRPEFLDKELLKAWNKLDSGILDERLLRLLWKDFNISDATSDVLISLMQNFGLICEKNKSEGDKRVFYVLSRLKPESVPSPLTRIRAVPIFHDFGGFPPDDLFQHGVTRFIWSFQGENVELLLAYEHVEMSIDEIHKVVLNIATIKNRRMFQTTIIRSNSSTIQLTVEDEPSPEVCKKVLNFLQTELRKFTQSCARGVKITIYIPCLCSLNIQEAHMHIMREFEEHLPCGSEEREVERYCHLFGDINQDVPQYQLLVLQPESYMDDAVIQTVSENIGLSRKKFGVCLGLNWCEGIKVEIEENEEAVKDMMWYWRSTIQSSRQHQLKLLCIALKQHKRKDLADIFFNGDTSDQHIVGPNKDRFSDQDLLFICDSLPEAKWSRLGEQLGISEKDIHDIEILNQQCPTDITMHMLVEWRMDQSENQIPIMIRALKEEGFEDVAKLVSQRHDYDYKAITKKNWYKNLWSWATLVLIASCIFSVLFHILANSVEDQNISEILSKMTKVSVATMAAVSFYITISKQLEEKKSRKKNSRR